jgi:hypothetical protein
MAEVGVRVAPSGLTVGARRALVAALAALPLLAAGCGGGGGSDGIPAELIAQSRPIGAEARFHPATPNRAVPGCARALGERTAAHVELFAADRVVVIPAGIGTEGPRRLFAGRVTRARCYGDVVTLEPTGIVLVRTGTQARLGDLFEAWRSPLTPTRLGAFAAPHGVRVYVNGRRLRVDPRTVPLSKHAEIVLETGPFVPPHRSFTFPRGY